VHVSYGREINVVQHVSNGQGGVKAFSFPRIEDPQTNRRKTDVCVDDEQLCVALWRAAQSDGGDGVMEHVDNTAFTNEIIEIRLLGRDVEVFDERCQLWHTSTHERFDVLGFHNRTKSHIWFNRVTALHSIAAKETSSSAWLTSGSFKKRVTVPIDCCGLVTCICVG